MNGNKVFGNEFLNIMRYKDKAHYNAVNTSKRRKRKVLIIQQAKRLSNENTKRKYCSPDTHCKKDSAFALQRIVGTKCEGEDKPETNHKRKGNSRSKSSIEQKIFHILKLATYPLNYMEKTIARPHSVYKSNGINKHELRKEALKAYLKKNISRNKRIEPPMQGQTYKSFMKKTQNKKLLYTCSNSSFTSNKVLNMNKTYKSVKGNDRKIITSILNPIMPPISTMNENLPTEVCIDDSVASSIKSSLLIKGRRFYMDQKIFKVSNACSM